MKSYDAGGLRGYLSTTNNFGTRVISNTKIISAASTALENVRFTFGSSTQGFTFEMTWFECNIYNNGTFWLWQGNYGGYTSSSGTWNVRFGPTARVQAGTNNGVGSISSSTNAFWWVSRTGTPTQNISSIYFQCFCDRWDLVTVTYS